VADVVYVFGPTRRVSVSDEDARYLVKSWLGSKGSLAGVRLNGDTKTALETGAEVTLTSGMNEVLVADLYEVEAEGNLNTEGLRALQREARKGVEFSPE